jgi:hypothetical protein
MSRCFLSFAISMHALNATLSAIPPACSSLSNLLRSLSSRAGVLPSRIWVQRDSFKGTPPVLITYSASTQPLLSLPMSSLSRLLSTSCSTVVSLCGVQSSTTLRINLMARCVRSIPAVCRYRRAGRLANHNQCFHLLEATGD